MIDYIINRKESSQSVIVTPNRAMSWRSLVVCYMGIAGFSLSVAMSLYLAGFPLVLPFSGAELLLLGHAFYVTAWHGNWKEIVIITKDKVMIDQGHNKLEAHQEFLRPWANVVLERSRNSWYPGRLLIRSKGRQLEIGEFLNEQERQGLAGLLSKIIPPVMHEL